MLILFEFCNARKDSVVWTASRSDRPNSVGKNIFCLNERISKRILIVKNFIFVKIYLGSFQEICTFAATSYTANHSITILFVDDVKWMKFSI